MIQVRVRTSHLANFQHNLVIYQKMKEKALSCEINRCFKIYQDRSCCVINFYHFGAIISLGRSNQT